MLFVLIQFKAPHSFLVTTSVVSSNSDAAPMANPCCVAPSSQICQRYLASRHRKLLLNPSVPIHVIQAASVVIETMNSPTPTMPDRVSSHLHKRSALPKTLTADDVSHFRSVSLSSDKSDPWNDDSERYWHSPPRRWKLPVLRYKSIELSRPKL